MFTTRFAKTAAPRGRTGTPATTHEEVARTPRRPYRRPEVIALGALDRLQYGYTGSRDGGHRGYTHYS